MFRAWAEDGCPDCSIQVMSVELNQTAEQQSAGRTPWRLALSSAILSLITYGLFALYGHVHWGILFRYPRTLPGAEWQSWMLLLNALEVYRLVGLAAIGVGIHAFTRRPRWPALVYGPLAVLAGYISVLIM